MGTMFVCYDRVVDKKKDTILSSNHALFASHTPFLIQEIAKKRFIALKLITCKASCNKTWLSVLGQCYTNPQY